MPGADTHAFFWFIDGSDRMPPSVAAAIEASGGSVFVSMASLWEMAIKVGLGRWPEAADIVAEFEYLMAAGHFQTLAILPQHIRLATCGRGVDVVIARHTCGEGTDDDVILAEPSRWAECAK